MEENNHGADASFSTFLAALREFRRDEGAVRATAHTASVSTTDWRQLDEALAKPAEPEG
jgi:hypothetical protein